MLAKNNEDGALLLHSYSQGIVVAHIKEDPSQDCIVRVLLSMVRMQNVGKAISGVADYLERST